MVNEFVMWKAPFKISNWAGMLNTYCGAPSPLFYYVFVERVIKVTSIINV